MAASGQTAVAITVGRRTKGVLFVAGQSLLSESDFSDFDLSEPDPSDPDASGLGLPGFEAAPLGFFAFDFAGNMFIWPGLSG